MSNQRAIHDLIRSLAGTDNKIVAHRTLCDYMGSLEGGVFLSQLLYWSDKGKDGWFFKSYREWEEEIYLTEYQVKKCAKLCVERGFLETELKKAKGAPTVHYRLDFDKFLDSILKNLGIHSEKFGNGFSEISETYKQENTSKNTTETTAVREGERAPAPPPPPVELPSRKGEDGKVVFRSPYVNKAHFDPATGFIRKGEGATAVEVYYERFDVQVNDQRLTGPMEDDLVRGCTDLALLREVIIAYDQAGYARKRNIKLILDWYEKPEKFRKEHVSASTARASPNGTSKVEASLAAIDEYERMKAAHGVKS